MKKQVVFDERAKREFSAFPEDVKDEFFSRFCALERVGYLEKPLGKKIQGYDNIFEIIVKRNGQWRIMYGYIDKNVIILLHSFRKKTQKTNLKDLRIAVRRLKFYY